MSEALSADLDSIWASVLVWEGGSIVKRITQNSPTRCSLSPCQLFSSIRPSIVPSFTPSFSHLPVCGYLCLCSSFQPCEEDHIVRHTVFYPFIFFPPLTNLNSISFSGYSQNYFITSPSKFFLDLQTLGSLSSSCTYMSAALISGGLGGCQSSH